MLFLIAFGFVCYDIGDTILSIGGYVKAEGIFYSPDKGRFELTKS